MSFILRDIQNDLDRAARQFAAVILTGPRRSGKTTLLRHFKPRAEYHLLEDPDVIAQIRQDPRSFVQSMRPPVILDEIQNAPELMNYLRTRIDGHPEKKGQFFLTGSQEAPLMRGVTESMAGRAAILQLYPLARTESSKVSPLIGGFPEALQRPTDKTRWFRSYLQTYLERDIRSVSGIRDLATFRRFLSLLATRSGQLLNKTDIAAPLGISVPTVSEWIGLLETTCQILLVQPYFENFGKRLVKTPKVYFADSGLLCHLLGIDTQTALERSPFWGPVFEGFVASEIVKHQVNHGRRKELYFFRDQQGLEIDFLAPTRGGGLLMLEVKASRTLPGSSALAPLLKLARSAIRRPAAKLAFVSLASTQDAPFRVVSGVQLAGIQDIPKLLG